MRPQRTRRTVAVVFTLAVVSNPLLAVAAGGDTAADCILGQPDAVNDAPNFGSDDVNAKGLASPFGVAFDASGNLFVADYDNNRVLCYRSPLTTGQAADLVFGQPNFNYNDKSCSASGLCSPAGVAVSSTGDLYVADTGNNRVLVYDRPLETDTVADHVFGQPDFTSREPNNGGESYGSLDSPWGVAVDSVGTFTRLWVSDRDNDRVLEYDNPVGTAGRPADHVLGQLDGGSSAPAAGATGLYAPGGLAVDANHNLWVADTGNNRVLEFNDPLSSFHRTADRVLGQPDFTSNTPNYTGRVSAVGLARPYAVSVDPNGNVYVCDAPNNRVVLFTAPLATRDPVADRVFGQSDFTSNTNHGGHASAQTLQSPVGVAIDPAGNVAVADVDDNRVVLLHTPTPIVTSLEVKVSPATGRRKLVVRGLGMLAGDAVVEVDGRALGTIRYKELAEDGSARRLVATDPNFDALVPPQVQVSVTIFDPRTGGRSAPLLYPAN